MTTSLEATVTAIRSKGPDLRTQYRGSQDRHRRGGRMRAKAGSDGKFSLQVPAGSYTVTGQSPMFVINGREGTCTALPGSATTITAGQSTTVTVVCPEK